MGDATLQLEIDLHDGRSRERVITALLNIPAISFMRDLRRMIDEDPSCLGYLDRGIRQKIQGLLSDQGIFWDEAVLEKQLVWIVGEVVELLRKVER